MAIAVDSTSNSVALGASSLTFSHTCTGSSLVLVVFISLSTGSISSVTYNGVTMSLARRSGTTPDTLIYTLVGPSTGAHNIVITASGSANIGGSGISFTGAVGKDGTDTATASSASASCTVNTNQTTGFVVVGVLATAPVTLTYTGAGTAFGAQDISTNKFSTAYEAYTGSANVTETWTLGVGNDWYMTGVEIYQAAPIATGGFFFAVDRR